MRYGEKPRPRVLVASEDAARGEDLIERFRHDLGLQTVGLVEENTYFPEWDCIAAFDADLSAPAQRLRVVSIGGNRFGRAMGSDRFDESIYRSWPGTSATEIELPAGLDPRIRKLVQSDLLPAFQRLDVKPYLYSPEFVAPFLVAGAENEYVLAGRFQISMSNLDHWVLPKWADPVAWLRLALEVWSEQDPERFPPTPEWWRSREWRTETEREAQRNLDATQGHAHAEFERLIEQVRSAETDLARVEDEADTRERVLLRGQGDDLVAATADALERLGFQIELMDEVFPEGSRREDLRVRLPDDSDFVAVVEVRGYTGGAKANDLMRLVKFHGLFRQDESRAPSALWYLVNHFLETPPSERPSVLASNEDEVESFAEDWNGLVIDTCDLFRLLDRVASRQEDGEDSRRLITESRGRLTIRPSVEAPSGKDQRADLSQGLD